jgi:hypothetical protein
MSAPQEDVGVFDPKAHAAVARVINARLAKVDLVLQVTEERTGAKLLSLGLHVINKELREGRWVCLTASTDDGRRVRVNIDAEVLENVRAPPSAT